MQTLNLEIRENLFAMYVNEELSTREIARKLGKTNRTISRWINEYEIPRRKAGRFDFPELRNKEWLVEIYTKQKKSTTEIGQMINASAETVRKWLIAHDIPRRIRIKSCEMETVAPEMLHSVERIKHKNGYYWTALL